MSVNLKIIVVEKKVTNLSCSNGKREEKDKGKNMSKEIANIVYSCKNILKIIKINQENKTELHL